jgi:hypothetical protein
MPYALSVGDASGGQLIAALMSPQQLRLFAMQNNTLLQTPCWGKTDAMHIVVVD